MDCGPRSSRQARSMQTCIQATQRRTDNTFLECMSKPTAEVASFDWARDALSSPKGRIPSDSAGSAVSSESALNSTLSHRGNPARNYCAAHTRDGGGNRLLARPVGDSHRSLDL